MLQERYVQLCIFVGHYWFTCKRKVLKIGSLAVNISLIM